MDVFSVLNLFGGLALFLFGMQMMGNALEKRAGNRLKAILSQLTSNPLKGFLLGLGVTAVIQSSSATTVMVVGFVNSGLMALRQSIYIIMGANVGTSVTSWILSLAGIQGTNFFIQLLKPTSFTPVLALLGILMYMLPKRQKTRDTAMILLGFAILMYGMDMMSNAVAPLSEVQGFTDLLLMFSNPVLGVVVGALLTAVIQSSSASVGILQALSLTGSVTYASAVPIIMGQNIGTCVTALISSVGATPDARRASLVHLYFNLLGMAVWLSVFYAINALFPMEFLRESVSPLGIAIIHTLFNLLCTALLMPFGKQLEWLATKTVHSRPKHSELSLLDERLFITPAVAVEQAERATRQMAETADNAITLSLQLLDNYTETGVLAVTEAEEKLDAYEDKIGTFLVKLASCDTSESDSREISKLLHLIGNFERIGDHAVNICDSAREMHEKQFRFSDEASAELGVLREAVMEILRLALQSFLEDNPMVAARVEPLEQVIDRLSSEIKTRHITRLTAGECTIELGFVLTDLLANLERVSDHCSNIAACVIEILRNSMDVHEYLNDIKNGGGDLFGSLFDMYEKQYSLNEK